MPKSFPCPNAECDYAFMVADLPQRAMVTCPVCGTRFPYTAGQAVKAVQPAAVPRRKPAADDVIVRREAAKGINPVFLWGGIGLAIVVLAMLIVFLNWQRKKRQDAPPDYLFGQYNFVFPYPERPWEQDIELRGKLGLSCFAYKKNEAGDAFFAVHAKTLERAARPGEVGQLRNDIIRTIANGPINREGIERAVLAGQPAEALFFQSVDADPKVVGEAYGMFYKGVAYVFVIWAPATKWDENKAELTAFRESFKIADLNPKWSEKRGSEVYFLERGGYEIEDLDGIWRRGKAIDPNAKPEKRKGKEQPYTVEAKDIDPAGEMVFLGKRPARDPNANDLPQEARTIITKAPHGGNDPAKLAQTQLLNRLKRESGGIGEVTVEEIAKSPNGIEFPTSTAQLLRLKSLNSDDKTQTRLHLVAILPVGEDVVIAEAGCKMADSEFMEAYMARFVGTLRARK